ncbi:hypothetical protein BSR29_04005 [Boudabousia liubingyangii]|uniref:Rieske domain-containing protein n=1 Tax=Boudabousia liubingyangii TaxID=1921764 RepID=A0A1Q5PN91_9ACTO|nr:Rieske 2Fe-2S domain-containing protein [Boudabousia liubingyangii]OKL47583.1 hypothetical protein BSR28_03575 [Boudabousia liubingyangii]OKL49007.1 hypothetical protein BSR29_04005 [Boudabousia liubingyangii]
MSLNRVCSVHDLELGEALEATLANDEGTEVKLAIIRDPEDQWYAIERMCPHGEVSLAEGEIETCAVECWAHGARFNLATGEATLPSPRNIKTYEITLHGEDVLVDVNALREGK